MAQFPEQSNERLSDPVVLYFATSPYGTVDAIVQNDGKSIYFYLNESNVRDGKSTDPIAKKQTVFGTRACWVRNVDVGPLVLNESEMQAGIAPMLPRTHCVHREPQPVPAAEHLHVVWLEEGNGAALIETRPGNPPTTLAVIPPWSGLEAFHGYAAECAIESPICSPLPDNPRLKDRIERASQFWAQWERSTGEHRSDPFSQLQPEILQAYEQTFQPPRQEPAYFSIDGGQFPPRGLVQYETRNDIVLATVGMSVCPQPGVELFTDNPLQHRRIELALRLPADTTKESIEAIAVQISGLSAYPWKNFTWFGSGHTCGLHDAAPNCESALLVHDQQLAQSTSEQVPMPEFRDDPINLLWLIPITMSDQQQLQDQTKTADEIVTAFRSS